MKLSFYCVDANYCDFLRKYDPHVPYTMDQKSTRPFVGMILSINGFYYYAPLTSPKPKHLHMKNQIDFLKINHGIWGAINLNNMIPVHSKSLQKINLKISPSDSKSEKNYKNLLANQLSWCTSHNDLISAHAQKLYTIISHGKGYPALTDRCCKFPANELQFLAYCQHHGLPHPNSPSD